MNSTVEVHVDERDSYWETTCWGCKLQVTLPQLAPIFKCGYCGAVTVQKSGLRKKSPSFWTRRGGILLDYCLVTLASLLLVLIVCGGVWTMFPILFPSPSFGMFVHSVITTFLTLNTLFNFVFAAVLPAGPPPRVEWGQFEVVDRGGLDNYKFCTSCLKPKPPAAHHCRTCRACVMEMDHHCPFIGNCVGANNQGYFLLFLTFTALSCLYVLIMSVYTYDQSRMSSAMILHDLPEPGTSGIGLDHLADVFSALLFGDQPLTITIRYMGLLYLFIISMGLLIGIGILLYQQLSLLYQGQTYLDSLSTVASESKSGSGRQGWANLRRVFGKGYPWLWLLPHTNSQKFQSRGRVGGSQAKSV